MFKFFGLVIMTRKEWRRLELRAMFEETGHELSKRWGQRLDSARIRAIALLEEGRQKEALQRLEAY